MEYLLSGSSHGFPTWKFQATWNWEALAHFVQLNAFSPPEWILSKVFKLLDVEKLRSHFVHLNGFSPVWVLSCSFKWPAIEKLLSHFDHRKIILCGSSFCHTLNIWKASLLCGSSHNSLRGPISRSSCHILSIWKASPLCGSSHDPSRNLMLKTLVTLCALLNWILPEWILSWVFK